MLMAYVSSKLSEPPKTDSKIANSTAKSKLLIEAREFFREQGRKGGKLSAAARMKKLTPEQRSAIAKKAVAAREAKRRRQRWALALPQPHVPAERLKVLSESEKYLFRSVVIDGVHPAELAKKWGEPETEFTRRVNEAIRKVTSPKAAPGSK